MPTQAAAARVSLLNVGALGHRPPPVGQVQQLQCEKRAVGAASQPQRRDHARGKRTYPCWTSGALWGLVALWDTAESRPPAPEGQAHAALQPLSSKLFSKWRLPQKSVDLRRCGSCSLRGSAIVGEKPHSSSHGAGPGN